ncbi:MAG TPA: hypothetical protein PJ997_00830 [Candidatus Paceibacterota bacterium]|nr:hypothetical protein [Candidatus Paceibacterota bacterium]HMP18867.1 hypothetical protein [Candidatus Paceibacterota bacterium]HMP85169.1 hypothetical protein [Candidatus Paceibacterota bacterium]
MNEITNTYKKEGKIHHFHILLGDQVIISDKIKKICFENLNILKENFHEYFYEKLLIDDTKSIISKSALKAKKNQKKVFCIYFKNITPEAQNVFLKTVEEPTKNTFFFFVTPSAKIFLPTILSRAILIQDEILNLSPQDKNLILDFFKKNIAEKIKFVDQIASEISEGKKPKSFAKEFFQKIILFLSEDVSNNKNNVKIIKKLQKNQRYFDDSGASTKILLEKLVIDLE